MKNIDQNWFLPNTDIHKQEKKTEIKFKISQIETNKKNCNDQQSLPILIIKFHNTSIYKWKYIKHTCKNVPILSFGVP